MKTQIFFLYYLPVFFLFQACSMPSKNWKVVDTSYHSRNENDRVFLEVAVSEGDNEAVYQVEKRYSPHGAKPFNLSAHVEKIAGYSFSLWEQEAVISVTREYLLSPEAVANPPVRIRYVLYLSVENTLLITKTNNIKKESNEIGEFTSTDDTPYLDDEFQTILDAIKNKKSKKLENSNIVQLAKWLLDKETPFTTHSFDEIKMVSCDIEINGNPEPLGMNESSYSYPVLNIPAGIGDTIILFPKFEFTTTTPYNEKLEIKKTPVPSYAYVRLENLKGHFIARGKPADEAGIFETGPIIAKDLRKLRIHCYLPLFPPGDKPVATIIIQFRNGREIEEYLDKGMLPPPVPVSENIPVSRLVPEVIKQVNASINPDYGTITALSRSDLLDINAFAIKEIQKYPGLLNIIKNLPFEYTGNIYPSQSSSEKGWCMNDALVVMENPSSAEDLVKKIERSSLPFFMPEYYTKKEPAIEKTKGNHYYNAASHILAAAALVNSNQKKYNDDIDSQIDLFVEAFNKCTNDSFPMNYLISAGQALKLVEDKSQKRETREKAGIYYDKIRKLALHYFLKHQETLSLKEKVRIAHLVSDVWRPYVNMPSNFTGGEEFLPSQGIKDIDGRDITGDVLSEQFDLYTSAQYRARSYIKNATISDEEKLTWLLDFFDKWRDQLFNSYKGNLQDKEEDINSDEQEAIKECGLLELFGKKNKE